MANARLLTVLSALFAMSFGLASTAHASVYCTITGVETKQLRNGVQITVKADGILLLDWGRSSFSEGATGRAEIVFMNARNDTGCNFIDVSAYPVSHLELSVPQDAEEGIGVKLAVVNYESSPVSARPSSDRTSYLITVTSSRTLDKSSPPKASAEANAGGVDLEVIASPGKVSVTAENVDIQRLLGEIAAKTGTNVAVDDAVSASVSIHLIGLPVAEVLRTIASAYGLALSEVGGVFMFSQGVPQDLAAYRLSGTASYPMRYTRAQAASGLLPTFLYSYLHVNEEQNAVVVTAPQQMLDKIKADLEAVDVAPPQILLEAVAVEFNDSAELENFIQLLQGDITGVTTGEEGYYGTPEYTFRSDPRLGLLSYATIGELPNDWEASLRVLETDQKARIRAAPRLAVMNGHEASIFIGVRRFIKVEFISYGQVTEKIQGVDVGVKLKVRPLTGGRGEITLTILPEGTEVSNISELDPQTGLPVLSTRQTGTTVRVMDGETVMIGGLNQQQRDDRTTKLPILGDLPLIGNLFRSRTRSTTTSELAVFITPHVLTPEGRLSDQVQEDALRARFLNQSPTP